MTRRESEPTPLDERGVSVIRLSLLPTSESLLWVVMAFCTIQRRRQASAPICDLTEDIESGDHAEKSRLPAGKKDVQCREAVLSIVSEKSLMTGFP